ncbi:MAG: hypothetical protein Pars93KO_26760 [Parasphingorhabdus sp.]
MADNWINRLAKPALLSGAMLSLSACAYGGGSYGDGYVNGVGYGCDPYAPFDDYYACDNGYGYANIGFGGGWYDSFYYPGYGIYIFDRRGSRYAMKRHHKRHWARKRAEYGWRKGGRRGERWRNLTPEQRAERRDRRAERRRNLTPEQRAERRDRREERLRNLTPEQRAERRERRAERRERRTDNGARTGRAALRDGAIRGQRSGEARQNRRANRQNNGARSERRARPAAAQQRRQQIRQQARPAVRTKARPQPRSVPRERPARRSSRGDVSRRNVNID